MVYKYIRYKNKFYSSSDYLMMKDIEFDSELIVNCLTEFHELPEILQSRLNRFAPNETPKNINIYDNGGTSADRYTCCFKGLRLGFFPYLAMSENPYSPQGVGLHCENKNRIDYPRYSHIGKKINWEDLPHNVKCCIWSDYFDYWNIPIPIIYIYGYK